MTDDMCLPVSASVLNARIATEKAELSGAFELIYRSYVNKGFIRSHAGRIVYQAAFGLPTSRTIVATTGDGALVGTLTIVGDNADFGLQLERTHPEEVESLRDAGRRTAEITCLTIASTGTPGSTAVFLALTEFTIRYAQWWGYDDLLMAIHPRHYRFYWRCFRSEPLGPCRRNVSVQGSPSVCCRIDLPTLAQNMSPSMRDQYFARPHPEAHFDKPPIHTADHLAFCSRCGIDLCTGQADERGRDAA